MARPAWSWLRYGRDPEYLDDDSILMPAPPPGMTPAAAAVLMDGRSRRHALTTAMVELASRGEISFRSKVGDPSELSIDITVPDQRDARLAVPLELLLLLRGDRVVHRGHRSERP